MTLIRLAELAEVTPRTVRYYIAQGLLPAPEGAGVAATYGDDHLRRLRQIKELQAQHLPLAEIRSRILQEPLPGMPEAAGSDRGDPGVSAADLAYRQRAMSFLEGILGPAIPPAGPAVRPAPAPAPVPAPVPAAPAQARPARSTWERHAISPDVEIHIQRPLSRDGNRRVDQLLEAARRIFEGDRS